MGRLDEWVATKWERGIINVHKNDKSMKMFFILTTYDEGFLSFLPIICRLMAICSQSYSAPFSQRRSEVSRFLFSVCGTQASRLVRRCRRPHPRSGRSEIPCWPIPCLFIFLDFF